MFYGRFMIRLLTRCLCSLPWRTEMKLLNKELWDIVITESGEQVKARVDWRVYWQVRLRVRRHVLWQVYDQVIDQVSLQFTVEN